MHKDIHVAEIEMTAGVMHITKILNSKHMPWGVRGVAAPLLDKRFDKWLRDRCIPKAQPNYSLLLKKAEVSSVTEMPTKSYMCSLTDCYWFKPIKDQVSWKDVNFFDNGFGWSINHAKKYLKRKDRRFWKVNAGGWGYKMRTYLVNEFELEGFTKEVLDTEDSWTEISFKINE